MASNKSNPSGYTSKPDSVEAIFTGRYAPPELIAAADLVTEMVEWK